MFIMYINHDHANSDSLSSFVTLTYNSVPHDATGVSPFRLVHVRDSFTTMNAILTVHNMDNYTSFSPQRAQEVCQLYRLRTQQAQQGQRLSYEKHHQEAQYSNGDVAGLWVPTRPIDLSLNLMSRYSGPYRALEHISDFNYRVGPLQPPLDRRSPAKDVVHGTSMSPCIMYSPSPLPPPMRKEMLQT